MNHGKFFALDTEALSDGRLVFNYRGLREHKQHEETRKYPFYLIISENSFDFYVHYCFEKTKASNETDENFQRGYYHWHSLILTLPISANLEAKDGLSAILAEAFSTSFPHTDNEGNNHLYKMVFHGSTSDPVSGIVSSVKSGDGITYSSLPCFDIFYNKAERKRRKELLNDSADVLPNNPDEGDFLFIRQRTDSQRSNSRNTLINRFIRKLFLDFLFDLEHTDIFQNSPYYACHSVRLRENFFFNALVNKANYYYYRENLAAAISRPSPKQKIITNPLIRSFIRKIKNRIHSIKSFFSDPLKGNAIAKDHFLNICQHVKRICLLRKTLCEILKQFISALPPYFLDYRKGDGFLLNLWRERRRKRKEFLEQNKINLQFYGIKLFQSELDWTKSIRDSRSDDVFHDSQGWFYSPEEEMRKIYEQDDAKDVAFAELYNRENEKKTKDPVNYPFQNFYEKIKNNASLSSQWYVKKYQFDKLNPRKKLTRSIMPCMFLFFGLSLLPFLIELPRGYFVVPLLPPIFAALKLWFISIRGFRGLHIFVPRLFVAVTAGWMTLVLGGSLLSATTKGAPLTENATNLYAIIHGKGYSVLLVIIPMVLGMLSFGYNVIAKGNRYLSWWKKFFLSFSLILLGYLYSYIIGFVIFLFRSDLFANCNWERIRNLNLQKTWGVFQKIGAHLQQPFPAADYMTLLFFIVVAMFAGVFLQLLVQEKSATEPL